MHHVFVGDVLQLRGMQSKSLIKLVHQHEVQLTWIMSCPTTEETETTILQ